MKRAFLNYAKSQVVRNCQPRFWFTKQSCLLVDTVRQTACYKHSRTARRSSLLISEVFFRSKKTCFLRVLIIEENFYTNLSQIGRLSSRSNSRKLSWQMFRIEKQLISAEEIYKKRRKTLMMGKSKRSRKRKIPSKIIRDIILRKPQNIS